MSIAEIRREKLRDLIETHSATKLATMLGYNQPSFLSQMAGPTPSRDITEKTARNFEKKLNLPVGYFDQAEPVAPASANPTTDTALVAEVIRLVGSICAGEKIEMPAMKFADVVALAYIDTMEHDKTPRPEHIKSIVRLLK